MLIPMTAAAFAEWLQAYIAHGTSTPFRVDKGEVCPYLWPKDPAEPPRSTTFCIFLLTGYWWNTPESEWDKHRLDQVHEPANASIKIRVTPRNEGIDVDPSLEQGEADTYYQALERALVDLAAKRAPGRPKGSYKHRNREGFEQQLRSIVRIYWLGRHKIPSRGAMARALEIDDATLNAALERFAVTDADLRRMVQDLPPRAED